MATLACACALGDFDKVLIMLSFKYEFLYNRSMPVSILIPGPHEI